jgi:hypothetical protein
MKNKSGWKFYIEYAGGRAEAWADSISVTDAGWIKFWRKTKLVGVCRHGEWTRVYVDAQQSERTS